MLRIRRDDQEWVAVVADAQSKTSNDHDAAVLAGRRWEQVTSKARNAADMGEIILTNFHAIEQAFKLAEMGDLACYDYAAQVGCEALERFRKRIETICTAQRRETAK